MNASGEKTTKKNALLRLIEFLIAITFGVYIVPAAKNTLFPDQMTRLEKMLRRSSMNGYHLAVDRKDELEIILTVYNGGQSISTEIYRDVIRELESSDDTRIFFSYSVNRDSNEMFYLTQTRIEADSDLKKLKRLDVGVCGKLADQHAGVTRFDGYKPIYECEVPEQEIQCISKQ